MASYKIIYVDARGRAELLRLMFAYKGVEFEDVRVAMGDIPEIRKESPLGIIPVLHTEGKVLSGNGTIARYLAEKFDLAADNALDNAELYGIVDALELLWNKFGEVFFETDPQKKEEKKQTLLTTIIPVYFVKLEVLANKSTCSEGWIYNKLTYADFAVFTILDTLSQHAPEGVLTKFPGLKKIYDNFQKIDAISKYLSTRPASL